MNASLYIHIPFCKKKCDYCDFFSIGESNRLGKPNDLSDSYISALVNETKFYADYYKISEWKTIYVGGGTPGLLSSSQIRSLFSGIKEIAKFAEHYETSFEVNPDNVSLELLETLKKAGVNRISMGIQALDDKALQSVNRESNTKIILNALELLQNQWNGRLSVDFIAGLPKHTWKNFKNQFEILKKYPKIDHVSLYTLTIEENTPLAKKIDAGEISFSYEKADKMWICGRNILEKMGFCQYEVSNFAQKGMESRHNQAYWKQENYVGIGAGASGTVYDFEKKQAVRWTNTLSIPVYISEFKDFSVFQDFPKTRIVEILDEKTLEFEFFMTGFRTLAGISASQYKERFGKSLSERLGADIDDGIFSKWEKSHLAIRKNCGNDTIFSLNKRGILFLNRFLEELM